MNKAKYEELFAAFGKAPMKEFLELLFEGVPPALKKRLIIEDVSYHRHNADIVTLEAWMVIDNPESDRWNPSLLEPFPGSAQSPSHRSAAGWPAHRFPSRKERAA